VTSDHRPVAEDYQHEPEAPFIPAVAVLVLRSEWPDGLEPVPTGSVSGVHAASEGALAPINTGEVERAETPSPLTNEGSSVPPTKEVVDAGDSVRQDGAWYVPTDWRDAYTACLSAPWRYDRTTWILTANWPRAEAEYVADHEGGWDACQFNTTQGSGACGWFQELPCEGLEPAIQIAVALRKYHACGDSFECDWYRWW